MPPWATFCVSPLVTSEARLRPELRTEDMMPWTSIPDGVLSMDSGSRHQRHPCREECFVNLHVVGTVTGRAGRAYARGRTAHGSRR